MQALIVLNKNTKTAFNKKHFRAYNFKFCAVHARIVFSQSLKQTGTRAYENIAEKRAQ